MAIISSISKAWVPFLGLALTLPVLVLFDLGPRLSVLLCSPTYEIHCKGGVGCIVDELFAFPRVSPAPSDDQLLERAVACEEIPPNPPNLAALPDSAAPGPALRCAGRGAAEEPRPKIAFMFLTAGALKFAPLWDRFFRGQGHMYNVYVHADPSRAPAFSGRSGGAFRKRLVPSRRTQRASPSLIAATRRLLAYAVLDDRANRYFALLSEHCIPLRGLGHMYRHLTASNRSFLEILDGEPTLWDRYNARGENVMAPEVQFSDFRVGSQFFVLQRRHAVMVLRDKRLWKKFRLPCLNADSCYPEEHYFPTLLNMQDPHGSAGYTLTRVNWTGATGGHPRTYRAAEVGPRLIAELRGDSRGRRFLFARKFSADCLPALLNMTDLLLG